MKVIRKIGFGIAALALGAVLAPATWAQDAQPAGGPPPPPPGAQGPGMRGGEHMDPQRQLRHLTRELNLNSGQQQQVGQILRERDAQVAAIRQNTSLTPEQMRRQAGPVMRESEAKLRAVLNQQQQQKFDAMHAEQKQKMEQRRGGMGGPPPAGGAEGGPGGGDDMPPPPPQQ